MLSALNSIFSLMMVLTIILEGIASLQKLATPS
jgi:hypothetical protein